MLIAIVVLFIVLIIKSVFFDEVKNLDEEPQHFKNYVDYILDEKHNSVLNDYYIITYRVYKIIKQEDNTLTEIKYLDPITNQTVEKTLKAKYIAKVRTYLFGIMPFNQFSVPEKTVTDRNK